MSRIRSVAAVAAFWALAPGASTVMGAEAAPEAVRFSNHSAQRVVAANSTAELRVACPAGTSVVGGGVDVEGGNTFTWIHASYPYDGPDADTRPDDGWAGAIANGTPNNRRMSTYAVCAASGTFTYVQRNGSVLAGTSSEGTEAKCAAGARVIGGGIQIMRATTPPSVSVLHSFPTVLTGPTVSWLAQVQHRWGAPASVAFRVFAICESGSAASRIRYETRGFDFPGGPAANPSVISSCGPGYVAIGGGVIMGDSVNPLFARSVHSTTPADGQDAGVAPGDAWAARLSSPDEVSGLVAALCSK